MTEKRFFRRLLKDCKGAATIEYAMICGFLVIGLVAALSGFADENKFNWTTVANRASSAIAGSTD